MKFWLKKDVIIYFQEPLAKRRLASRMAVAETTLNIQLRQNNTNGRLTKMDALTAISKEMNTPIFELLDEAK